MENILSLSLPKISCIVPVYNVEMYLNRCVDSILSQTFTDFELILVDDGSPDNCGKICDEYANKDSRIKVIHQENKGVSAARNAGLDAACGEYVCFMDSDDWVEANYMKAMYDAAVETEADLVVCGYKQEVLSNPFDKKSETILKECPCIFCNEERIVYHRKDFFKHFPKMRCDDTFYLSLQSPCMRLIRRIQGDNFPRFDVTMKYNEDYLFNLKIYEKINSVCYIKPSLYIYRYVQGSASNQYSEKKVLDLFTAINETETFFKRFCPKKTMESFYKYKKTRLSIWVKICFTTAEFEVFSMLDLIRKEINIQIIMTDFFNIMQTLPLLMAYVHWYSGGQFLGNLYLRKKKRSAIK